MTGRPEQAQVDAAVDRLARAVERAERAGRVRPLPPGHTRAATDPRGAGGPIAPDGAR